MTVHRIRPALAAALLPLIAACAQQPTTVELAAPASVTEPAKPVDAEAGAAARAADADKARVFKGTGIVVRGQDTGGTLPTSPPPPPAQSGPVVLNFEGADHREVVRNVLGDILNQPYTIDPNVGGQVTIRTTAGIQRDALPATLETLLRMNGATMVYEGNLWKIVPQTAALRGNVTPQLGNSTRALPQGYSVQIVPLKYVGVRDMLRIL
jgi:general secretion pathway protein D